jgi:CMP-N-acetylneuraminate monooxygenase
MTDPWLIGPAFMTGWWLLNPPKAFSIDCIKNTSLLFVSHNHPDHLHPETLQLFDKDTTVITAAFNSGSSEKMLKRTGFRNVIPLPFKEVFQWKNEQIYLSVLKSGDFRDDSGLYLNLYGFELLLTVDSNFINGFILPQNIQLLLTSFASGASGYPLCYDRMMSVQEQERILKRNRSAALLKLSEVIKRTNPQYYIPYAGYFKEKAKRDEEISNSNIKNSYYDVKNYLRKQKLNTTVLNPLEWDHFTFGGDGSLQQNKITGAELYKEENGYFDSYIASYQQEYFLEDGLVEKYFQNVTFRDNLQLFLIPANDDFNPFPYGYIVDFSKPELFFKKADVNELNELYNSASSQRKEYILVRSEVLGCIIKKHLPWEDMSIGFQCRFKRNPDVYNAAFWHYFTNIYVGEEDFRYDSYCGGLCTKMEQNMRIV